MKTALHRFLLNKPNKYSIKGFGSFKEKIPSLLPKIPIKPLKLLDQYLFFKSEKIDIRP